MISRSSVQNIILSNLDKNSNNEVLWNILRDITSLPHPPPIDYYKDEDLISRVEVIDHRPGYNTRALVCYDVAVATSIQDIGHTLKIFISDLEDK